MSATLERKQVIELLDKLGSDQDEDVLSAARTLHKQIAGSGMSWDDLLVGDGPGVEGQAPVDNLPSEVNENDTIEIETAEPDTEFTGDETQTLFLIEELLQLGQLIIFCFVCFVNSEEFSNQPSKLTSHNLHSKLKIII